MGSVSKAAGAKGHSPLLSVRLGSILKAANPRALWYERSVRTQLILAVGAINLLAVLAAGAIAIFNTRVATRVEIEASLEVAQRFVAATVRDLAAQGKLDRMAERMPEELRNLRHVRVLLTDGQGNLAVLSPAFNAARQGASVPKWFASLVAPKLAGRAVKVVTANHVPPVIIVGEPADELAEAWQEFYVLALTWLALNAFILVLLYVVLGRVLDPLASLSRGLLNLEDGDYGTRLKPPKVKELAVITGRFNMLASALETAREENRHLYRQLISVQERERREIANELHDEAGPCLFGITANASSVRSLAEQMKQPQGAEISRRVNAILSITERLKQMNRALLKKLRPGPLGDIEFSQLLDELIAGFQRCHPETQIVASIGKLASSYGETIHVTLYRCLQEGITNAIRHGRARNIEIDIVEHRKAQNGGKRTRPSLRLILRDDGIGFSRSTPKGFGLTTMSERLRAIGGSCTIDSAPSQGTTLSIEIPIQRPKAERSRRLELLLAGQ